MVEALRSASTRGHRVGYLDCLVLVVSAATAAGLVTAATTSAATLCTARHEEEDDEEQAPAALLGDEVVHRPVHQALRGGPEEQMHEGSEDPADGVLPERAAVHLLRDGEHVATEVAEAHPDAPEEVGKSDEDVSGDTTGSVMEVDGVAGIVKIRAADRRHHEHHGERLVVPRETQEAERKADDPPDQPEG